MRRLITQIFIIFIYILGFSQLVVLFDEGDVAVLKLKIVEGKSFVNIEEAATQLNLELRKAKNVYYIIKNQHLLEVNLVEGYTRIDFLIKYPNTVFLENSDVYVESKVMSNFLYFKYFESYGKVVFFKKPVQIISVKKTLNQMRIVLSRKISEEQVIFKKIGNKYILTLFPMVLNTPIPSDLEYVSPQMYVSTFSFTSDLEYLMQVKDNEITLTYIPKKEEKKETPKVEIPKVEKKEEVSKPETKVTIPTKKEEIKKEEKKEEVKKETKVETQPIPKPTPVLSTPKKTEEISKEKVEEKISKPQISEEIKKETEIKAPKKEEIKSKKISPELIPISKGFEINGNVVNVHYVVFDPKIYNIEILLNSISSPDDMYDFLLRKKPLIAINGGYFNPSTLEPIGKIIDKGEIVHISPYVRPCFILTLENRPEIFNLQIEYKVYIKDVLFWIKGVNTNWKADAKLYTPHFKGIIKETTDAYLFYLVENGKIKYIGKRTPKGKEKLLVINAKYAKYLADVKVGDTVFFVVDTNFYEPIKLAIEGGPVIYLDGVSDEFLMQQKLSYPSNIINSRSPRTIIAITDDEKVMFIVVEGYNDKVKGINFDETVELLRKMGNVRKAIMLDGGSSSVFYYEGKVLNFRKENWRRRIPVFVGIYK